MSYAILALIIDFVFVTNGIEVSMKDTSLPVT